MSTTDMHPPADYRRADRPGAMGQVWQALRATTDWLDGHGRPAWFVAAVAGLFVAPPLGVAILLFMLGTGRMFSSRHRHDRSMSRSCGWGRREMRGEWEDRMRSARAAMRPSGNTTFDAYKTETLRRLEEEQRAFEEFLGRLREAKDKAEFDQFMDDRAHKARAAANDEQDDAA
jgi:hypothetical protein